MLTLATRGFAGIAVRRAVVVLVLGAVAASCTSGAHQLPGETARVVGGQCKTTDPSHQVTEATVSNPTAYFETVRLSTGDQGMETPLQPHVTEQAVVPGCGVLTAKVVWAARVHPNPGGPPPPSS